MERPDLSMGTRHALTCRLTCAWSDALHDLGCFPASFELCSPFLGETGLVSPLSASEAELEGTSPFTVFLGLAELHTSGSLTWLKKNASLIVPRRVSPDLWNNFPGKAHPFPMVSSETSFFAPATSKVDAYGVMFTITVR